MKRDSFIFYRSFFEAIKELPDDNDKLRLFETIAEYSLNFITSDLTGIPRAFFNLIKPQLDANNRKWENGKKGAEYGKMGGRPKKENPKETPKKPQTNPKLTPNVNVNVNVNDNVKAFYEKELAFSNNNPNYKKFIDVLFGRNSSGKPLEKCLAVDIQVSYDNFQKLIEKKQSQNGEAKTLTDILEALEFNSNQRGVPYLKGTKNLYRKILSWYI